MTPEQEADAFIEQRMQEDAQSELIFRLPHPRDYEGVLSESRNGWRWEISKPIMKEAYWHDLATWYRGQLQPYLDAEEAQRKQEALNHRVQWLVDICIPRHNGRLLEHDKPIRHPNYADWWNGASVVMFNVLTTGNVHAEVRSYVGGGEYENKEITLLKEWMEVDKPISVVQEWCIGETKRLAEERKEYLRQDVLRKMESLSKQLANLSEKQ